MEIIPETTTVTTPIQKHVIVARSFITGTERRSNRRFLLALNDETDSQTIDRLEKAEDHLLNLIIISIDGNEEEKSQKVLAMHADDYDFVIKLVNQAVAEGGLDKKKELISNGSTENSSKERPSDSSPSS